MDYNFGSYNVMFPAGVTQVSFNVYITDDYISEGIEDFLLTINSFSLTSGVTRGEPGQAVVTIVDNGCKYCNLKALCFMYYILFQ